MGAGQTHTAGGAACCANSLPVPVASRKRRPNFGTPAQSCLGMQAAAGANQAHPPAASSLKRSLQNFGTAAFAAPELLTLGRSSPKADIYSLGLISELTSTGGPAAHRKVEPSHVGQTCLPACICHLACLACSDETFTWAFFHASCSVGVGQRGPGAVRWPDYDAGGRGRSLLVFGLTHMQSAAHVQPAAAP